MKDDKFITLDVLSPQRSQCPDWAELNATELIDKIAKMKPQRV